MPQIDRYKKRTVNIDFRYAEDFVSLPYQKRFTIVFVTNGHIKGTLNQRPIAISAPAVLCLSEQDVIHAEKREAAAQSFSFDPEFLSTIPISKTEDYFLPNLKIHTGVSLFQREGTHTGVPCINAKVFPKLLDWFFIIGTEVFAQSDSLWVCRIKKNLIQLLGLLESLSTESEQSPVDLVLEYIHTNYAGKITLEDITLCAHLNRVSLNELFRERCNCTAMSYLAAYRLKVAEDLLTHTGMNLNEIARSTGFEYDTYFIKQFSAKKGMSPTAFRNTSRKLAGYL
ncbi:MAG: helix-turn-helix domain-containing protein [Lachnospiraceae bacterium]